MILSLNRTIPRSLRIRSRLCLPKIAVKCLARLEMEPVKKRKFIPEECELVIDIDPKGSCYFNVVSKVESLYDSASSEETESIHSEGTTSKKIRKSTPSDVIQINGSLNDNSTKIKLEESKKIRKSTTSDIIQIDSSLNDNTTKIELEESVTEKTLSHAGDASNISQLKEGCEKSELRNCGNDSSNETIEVHAEGDTVADKDNEDRQDCKSIPAVKQYVSLDCEFVGITGDKSALGRCSIVDFEGQIICDIYARPLERIYSYRTKWSGITRNDMIKAIPIESALSQISDTIKDKIVIGHGIHNDFQVLGFGHPEHLIRDTQKCDFLNHRMDMKPPISLRNMADRLLGVKIQQGAHCSVEDARTAMELFKLVRVEWETSLLQNDREDGPDSGQSSSVGNHSKITDCDTKSEPFKALDKMLSVCHKVLNGKIRKKKKKKKLTPFRLLDGVKTVNDYFKQHTKVLKQEKNNKVKSPKSLLKTHYDKNVKHLLSDQYWLHLDSEDNIPPS